MTDVFLRGFDTETLRDRFDEIAAQARLDELAAARSTDALIEKTHLLRIAGRTEEARQTAAEALREARHQPDRGPLARAKVARAGLFADEGKHEFALHELSDALAEAEASEWFDVVADARRQRALIHAALGEFAAAREDLNEALGALLRTDAAAHEIDLTMIALGAILDRIPA
jgi:tetratricopeptide (TPR) repeat protein